MKEWAEADNQSKNLPKSERQALNEVNSDMTRKSIGATIYQHLNRISITALSLPYQHFQSVLQTLEEQVGGERQRLVETHLARVEATLNNNRRQALESYLAAVQTEPPQVRHTIQYKKKRQLIRNALVNLGTWVVYLPPVAFSDSGFLSPLSPSQNVSSRL